MPPLQERLRGYRRREAALLLRRLRCQQSCPHFCKVCRGSCATAAAEPRGLSISIVLGRPAVTGWWRGVRRARRRASTGTRQPLHCAHEADKAERFDRCTGGGKAAARRAQRGAKHTVSDARRELRAKESGCRSHKAPIGADVQTLRAVRVASAAEREERGVQLRRGGQRSVAAGGGGVQLRRSGRCTHLFICLRDQDSS